MIQSFPWNRLDGRQFVYLFSALHCWCVGASSDALLCTEANDRSKRTPIGICGKFGHRRLPRKWLFRGLNKKRERSQSGRRNADRDFLEKVYVIATDYWAGKWQELHIMKRVNGTGDLALMSGYSWFYFWVLMFFSNFHASSRIGLVKRLLGIYSELIKAAFALRRRICKWLAEGVFELT